MAIEMTLGTANRIRSEANDEVELMNKSFDRGVFQTILALEDDLLRLRYINTVVNAIQMSTYDSDSLLPREHIADALCEVYNSQKETLHRINTALGLCSVEEDDSDE